MDPIELEALIITSTNKDSMDLVFIMAQDLELPILGPSAPEESGHRTIVILPGGESSKLTSEGSVRANRVKFNELLQASALPSVEWIFVSYGHVNHNENVLFLSQTTKPAFIDNKGQLDLFFQNDLPSKRVFFETEDQSVERLRNEEPKDMRTLRWLLAQQYAGHRLYTDDGEYSDPESGIDFRRDPIYLIQQKMNLYAERKREKMLESLGEKATQIDSGDVVWHAPSKELWVVALVQGAYVWPAGWPSGRANLSDCALRTKASPESRFLMLSRMAQGRQDDERTRIAMDILKSEPTTFSKENEG